MSVRALLVCAALCTACNSSSSAEDATEASTGGSSNGTTTEGVATTYSEPDGCSRSADCPDSQVCAAAYDPGTASRGPATCVSACIDQDDLSRWCLDNDACCDDMRCNSVDGFCSPRGGTDTTSDEGDSSGDTTDTGSTGTTTGDKDDTSSTGKDDTSSSTGDEGESSSSSSTGDGSSSTG